MDTKNLLKRFLRSTLGATLLPTLVTLFGPIPQLMANPDSDTHQNEIKPNTKTVYKTINPDGSVSFSDVPTNQDSETIEVKEASTIPIKVPRIRTSRGYDNTQAQSAKFKVSIQSPAQGETFRNVSHIPIIVKLDPPYGGARFEITHNGSVIEDLELVHPERGEHRIQIKAFSYDGQLLGESEHQVFYVHRPIIKRNAAN